MSDCKKCGKMTMVGVTEPTTNVEIEMGHAPFVDLDISKSFHGVEQVENPKSYNDIKIIPQVAPDIQTIRSENFKLQLVEIEAANVVKGFCKPPAAEVEAVSDCDNTPLPETCINKKSEHVSSTQGRKLDYSWRDTRESSVATLLARCGDRLVQLTGEGALWLDKGKVYARKSLPLRVSNLWHKWFLPTPTSNPIIGQPMPFPYQSIADIDGNVHAIQGLSGEDSVTIWDFEEKHFYQKPVSDFPVCVRQKLASANRLEMVGFDPLSVSDNPSDLRKLKKIQGEGVMVFKEQNTTPTELCDCESCESASQVADSTTVAEFIANPITPTSTGAPWVLGYDFVTNTHRYYDAATVSELTGPEGPQGEEGIGIQGERGEQGTVGSCC